MSNVKYCPQCGGEILAADRFCGECGFDTESIAANQQSFKSDGQRAAVSDQARDGYTSGNVAAETNAQQRKADSTSQPPSANRNALLILISVLLLVFFGGGGLYWWLNQGDDPNSPAARQDGQQEKQAATQAPGNPSAALPDLSRASTYLPEPGLKCSFYANYPDGTSGEMERYTARVVPAEAVRASDAEIGVDNGQEYGAGTHYVERPDGIYLIYDSVPMEISPLIKNNLITGLRWDYTTEYGSIFWTVVDMGVTLDLGFSKLENCLLLEEDNQAAGYKSIVYYAPGMGKVMEKYSNGGEVLKLTAFKKINQKQAAEKVIQWSPNYQIIKDDRTQS